MFTCLYRHSEPIFHQAQNGFRKNFSCVVQLLVYLESIYKSIDSKGSIDTICTDYEKAFDNVDHGIFLTKLFNLGVRGKIIKLLQSYLIGRTQRVRINSHFSESVKVTSEVPQGSLLASLFFVIYVNDLPETCRAVVPLLCADDAKFISVNKPSLICQMDLTRVMKRSEQHKLPLNVEKCSHISMSNTMHHFSFSVTLIERVHIKKYLGVYVKRDLKWDIDIKKSASKALGALFMLKRSSPRPTPSVKLKLNLYKSMVLPVLLYGSVCWFANVTNTKVLKSVQKKSLKWINNTSNNNYKELLYFCRILPLSFYLQLQDLLFLSKSLSGQFNFNIDQFVCMRNTTRSLRSDNDLKFQPRLEICHQSFYYRTCALVNRLPQSLQFGNAAGLKNRLLNFLWHQFETSYNELVIDTWKT